MKKVKKIFRKNTIRRIFNFGVKEQEKYVIKISDISREAGLNALNALNSLYKEYNKDFYYENYKEK